MRNRYKVASLILALIFLVFLPHNNLLNQVDQVISSKTVLEKNSPVGSAGVVKEAQKVDHTSAQVALIEKVKADLAVNQEYSLAAYDINNAEFFGVNETTPFHAASVMKVLIATAALEEVEKGRFTLKSPLGNSTFQFQLQQMINQSNNFSWDAFNNALGFNREQQTADRLGLTGVTIYGNQMTTKGVSELLLKLYKGEVLTKEHRDLLFSYMQKTETENRISPAIPDGVTFYHKTGTFEGGLHDAAVIIHPKNPFILVVFTKDLAGTPHATRAASIQAATQKVYQYFDSI